MQEDDLIARSLYSDASPRYLTPAEPEAGDTVQIRLRVRKDAADRVLLLIRSGDGEIPGIRMAKAGSEGGFDFFETELIMPDSTLYYRFLVECGGKRYRYTRTGAVLLREYPGNDDIKTGDFSLIPGFHVPHWLQNAVLYQIFPDRFCNGNILNDVTDNEYYYTVGHVRHVRDWHLPPSDTDIRDFYGGDLQGIFDKLDYLESLGVEAIYLNPIFVSPSSHKYDVQDYDHVDPHLAVITDDLDHEMQSWEKHNGYAPKYIRRVTSETNLEKSDALFRDLCQELHRRGMKIILDGVFNHAGSFHKWFDKEGIYRGKKGFPPGAYQTIDSPYRTFFSFQDSQKKSDEPEYEGWWGYETLPKLNYEGSPELEEEILRIAEKWVSPPYSIDGWRLDVAADLGHSTAYNHAFWKKFRKRVKAVNPDVVLLAEHYGDPSDWLRGDEWDTVMNYDAFMEPVSYFLTGMEKHSDFRREELYQNGEAFFDIILRKMAALPSPSLASAMNELSNHDHSRFLTRTNHTVGRMNTLGSDAAGTGIQKSVFREAVVIQMTWPGAPTVYYADEAGQVGFTDPDSRRTYPWGREDKDLIALHRTLIALRHSYAVFRDGSLKPLFASYGQIAYARFTSDSFAIVSLNNTETEKTFVLPVWETGAPAGTRFVKVLETGESGYSEEEGEPVREQDGFLTFTLPPFSSSIHLNEPTR